MLQETYVLFPSGADYATLHHGYSSLKSGHLESAIGTQGIIQQTGISVVSVK